MANFQKPLFQTWAMFVAMLLSLGLHGVLKARERAQNSKYQAVDTQAAEPEKEVRLVRAKRRDIGISAGQCIGLWI